MTKKIAIIQILFLCSAILRAQSPGEVLGEKVLFERVTKDSKGRLLGGTLAAEAVLQHKNFTLTIEKGSDILLYKTGLIRHCTLGASLAIPTYAGTVTASRGSLLSFDEEGELRLGKSLIHLHAETTLTIRDAEYTFSPRSRLFFIDNNTLDFNRSELYPARPYSVEIDRTKVVMKAERLISFFEDGKVRSGTTGEPVTLETPYGPLVLMKENRIFFDPASSLDYTRTVFLPAADTPLTINGRTFTFRAAKELLFHKEGTLKEGVVTKTKDLAIAGFSLDLGEGSRVNFNRLGKLDLEKSILYTASVYNCVQQTTSLSFAKNSRIHFFNNNIVRKGVLNRNTDLKVYGVIIPCKSGTTVYFQDSGAVDLLSTTLVLAENIMIPVSDQEVVLKAGTRLHFRMDGRLDFMKTAVTIGEDGQVMVQGKAYPVKAGTLLRFYPEGGVHTLTTGQEISITSGPHTFALPRLSKITFTGEGKISSIYLGKTTTLISRGNTLHFEKEKTIYFYPDGTIREGVLAKDNVVTVGKLRLPLIEGTNQRFFQDGSPIIQSLVLPLDTELLIGDHKLLIKKGSRLSINEKKQLNVKKSSLILSEDTLLTVGGNQFTAAEGKKLIFYPKGNLRSVYIKNNPQTVIGTYNLPLAGKRYFHFKESGQVDTESTDLQLSGVHTISIKGIDLPLEPGTPLHFLQDNSLDLIRTSFKTAGNADIQIGPTMVPVKAGSRFFFNEDGTLNVKKTDCKLYGYLKVELEGLTFNFMPDKKVGFHPGLEIASGYVFADRELVLPGGTIGVQGRRTFYFEKTGRIDYEKTVLLLTKDSLMKAGLNTIPLLKDSRVIFHPNQVLEFCTIKEDLELNFKDIDITIKKDRSLYFDHLGRIDTGLTKLVLAKNARFTLGKNTIDFMAGTRIYFFDDGSIRQGILAEKTTLGLFNFDIELRKGKRIFFTPQGSIDAEMTEIYLEKNTPFKVGDYTLTFKKRTRVYFNPLGKITRGTLAEHTVLEIGPNKVPVSSDHEIEIYPDGTIKKVFLSRITRLTAGETEFPAGDGTAVHFYPGGALEHGELDSHTPVAIGGGTPVFKQYSRLYFYPSGVLRQGMLKQNTPLVIGENTLTFDSATALTFFENGNLTRGFNTEEKKIIIHGTAFTVKKDEFIDFYPSGSVKKFFIGAPLSIKAGRYPITFQGNTPVILYENGAIQEGFANAPYRLKAGGQEAVFSSRSALTFFPDGTLQEGVLLENSVFTQQDREITFTEGTAVSFYKSGLIKKGFPAAETPVTYKDTVFYLAAEKELSFYPSGNLRYGCINREITLTTRNGEKLLLSPGHWLFIREEKEDFREFYAINRQGVLQKSTPVEAGGLLIVIPEGSKVAFKGDDTLFKVLVPSSNIYLNKQPVATGLVEIYYSDFEKNITGAAKR